MNKQLDEKGFYIIEDFFSKKDIESMRKISLRYFSNGGGFKNCGGRAKPDWIKEEELAGLLDLCDLDRIENTVSEIVGKKVFFIEHNDLHLNRTSPWHKDRLSGESRVFENNDPWSSVNGEKMQIYKVNIYLQDHKDNNDGLTVIEGSHKFSEVNINDRKKILRFKLGDIVVFDQRITHSAKWSGGYDRVLICMGFGVKNVFFEEFKKGTVFRQNKQNKKNKELL